MKASLIVIFLLLVNSISLAANLEVRIRNIKNAKGVVRLNMSSNEESYDDQDNFVREIVVPAKKGSLRVQIRDIDYGYYAITTYHDENNNGELDKSFWGFPTERFGISNVDRAPYSRPEWEEVKFWVEEGDNTFNIKLVIH